MFFQCGFYGRFWYLLSLWLEFDSAIPSTLTYHFWYFTFVVGFSQNIRKYILIIWFSCVWIIWKIYKYYAKSYVLFILVVKSSISHDRVGLILLSAFSLFHSFRFVFLFFRSLWCVLRKGFLVMVIYIPFWHLKKTKQKHLTLSHLFGHVDLASQPFWDMCPPFGTFYLAIIISMFPLLK